jgi:hypothetical protein
MSENNCSCSKCGIGLYRKPSRLRKYKDQFCGNECKAEFSIGKRTGRDNPYCKFKKLDDSMFSNVTTLTEAQAYFLGFVASDGHVKKRQVFIKINKKDIDILEKFKTSLDIESEIKIVKDTFSELTISSKQMAFDLCSILGVDYEAKSHKKSHSVKFPIGLSEENYRHFTRGFFDGDGWVNKEVGRHSVPVCGFTTNSTDMRRGIYQKVNVRGYESLSTSSIKYSGSKFTAFLDYIYKDATIYLNRKYALYQKHKEYKPRFPVRSSTYIKEKE